MLTIIHPVLFAMLVAGHFGCSCSGNPVSDADAVVDAPDGDAVEDTQNDTPSEQDTADDSDETDSDAAETPSDCFLPFDGGYDLSGLGLEVIPRDRPPTECGECCRQISFFSSGKTLTFPHSIDVWGRYLVYSDRDSYCSSNCWDRIILVDLQEGEEYTIDTLRNDPETPGLLAELLREPSIYQQYIYYSHSRLLETTESTEHNCEIIRYSLLTGLKEAILDYTTCGSGCWCASELDAYDKYLVWEDNRAGYSGGQRVHVIDKDSGIEAAISDSSVGNTSVWDGIITYDSFPTSLDTINVFEILTSSNTEYSDGIHDRWYIRPWGNLITWSDARAGGTQANQAYADIYMMDLEDSVEIPVCTDPASQFGSFVFGDLVVWSDLRNDPLYPNNYVAATNRDVYGYRISTGEEFQITSLPGKEWAMHLFDNHVFFLMEDDFGVESIFMKDVR